jgi:hypothetical protein
LDTYLILMTAFFLTLLNLDESMFRLRWGDGEGIVKTIVKSIKMQVTIAQWFGQPVGWAEQREAQQNRARSSRRLG